MKFTYKHTIYACFIGYIVQAIVNNFAPLLFLTFQRSYGIPLSQITMLVTINFSVQLLVDLLAVGFVDKVGYRASMLAAHIFAALGFLGLVTLPELLPSAFAGLVISVTIYAIGGGLLEVLVSPVMEACPTENKEKAMSLLHSFYCWGHVGVVLISTLCFQVFGIRCWKAVALFWMAVPLANFLLFTKVPLAPLVAEGERSMSLKELFRSKVFWILMVMMVCAGASEQAVSQWASTLAEKGLGISKPMGDLMGPMMFAVLMGLSRMLYGKFGERIALDKFMLASSGLCILALLLIAFVPNPVVNLIGCGLCGLSVGILWPGSFSKAASAMPLGGTAMFAMLALGGDLGCGGGPTLAGLMASVFGDDLQKGIAFAVVFPVVLIGMLRLLNRKGEANEMGED